MSLYSAPPRGKRHPKEITSQVQGSTWCPSNAIPQVFDEAWRRVLSPRVLPHGPQQTLQGCRETCRSIGDIPLRKMKESSKMSAWLPSPSIPTGWDRSIHQRRKRA